GAPFSLGEPEKNGWNSPTEIGTTTLRVEVFVDDPDSFVKRAIDAGAQGGGDDARDHQAPWGTHRQGGFVDPFGHIWLGETGLRCVGCRRRLRLAKHRHRSSDDLIALAEERPRSA